MEKVAESIPISISFFNLKIDLILIPAGSDTGSGLNVVPFFV